MTNGLPAVPKASRECFQRLDSPLMPYIDRTVRTYAIPSLKPRLILAGHRAAVNAISLSSTQIVSASGDRSVRLWDANTGQLLHTFEGHHARGLVSRYLLQAIF